MKIIYIKNDRNIKILSFFFSAESESRQQIQGSLQSLNLDSMIKHTFIPDYSVRAVSEVFYVAIKRTLYLAAKRATLMERSQKYGDITNQETMDDEVEKVFFFISILWIP